MVTINGEKMSKSLGNIRSIKRVLEDWGPNIMRLFCISGHYSKPIDYSEELLKENLTKWRQAEICFYEMVHASGQAGGGNIKKTIQKCAREFDSALECDFNTHLALSAFFMLVKEINRVAAEDGLGSVDAEIAGKEFARMSQVLGLNLPKVTSTQKSEVDTLVSERERLRREKHFEDADKIRDKLSEMNIDTIDHKGKTVWIKKEKIKADM